LHREVEEEEKDDVISWFTKRMKKAKEFQPVAVLNQKLKGLEVFEPNSSNSIFAGPSGSSTASARPLSVTPDPDELVTRAHWQRATNDDYCLEPTCRKPLGVINGSVNCMDNEFLFPSDEC
jgi:rabenosyn-5